MENVKMDVKLVVILSFTLNVITTISRGNSPPLQLHSHNSENHMLQSWEHMQESRVFL